MPECPRCGVEFEIGMNGYCERCAFALTPPIDVPASEYFGEADEFEDWDDEWEVET